MENAAPQHTHIVPKGCSTCPLTTVRRHQVEGKARVVTILEPAVRRVVDTAVSGSFTTVHVDALGDVVGEVRRHTPQALLVSLRAIEADQVARVGRVVRECPGVWPVAVVTERLAGVGDRLLQLGAQGFRQVLDLNDRVGWCRLRCIVAEAGGEVGHRIMSAVMAHLATATPEAKEFFAMLIRAAPRVRTVREFAGMLSVEPSTLVSRFYRAGLPSPKRYLAGVRLLFASAYLETPGRSIAQVADLLDYSSPQSFARHVNLMLGMSAGQFRSAHPFNTILAHHVGKLVVPFARRFRAFTPISDEAASQVGSLALKKVA